MKMYMCILGHDVKVFFPVGCGKKCLKSLWYKESIGEDPEGMREHHSGGDFSGAEEGVTDSMPWQS